MLAQGMKHALENGIIKGVEIMSSAIAAFKTVL